MEKINMQIINAVPQDIVTVFKLYDKAIGFQKTVFDKHWQGFERSLIEREISENRLWKIVEADEIVCIFSIAFSDSLIWGEKDDKPSIYIHRIVTNPLYRGRGYVKVIVEWAKDYSRKSGKKCVRLDTWGDNQKLIDYYQNCGFSFLGVISLKETNTLPKHYQGISLSLFEIKLRANNH
jgi:RimJ/RimL family protein N-acetyltransferase